LSSSIQWSKEDNNITEAIGSLIVNEKYYLVSKISELPDSFFSIPSTSIDLNKGMPINIDRSTTFDLLSVITNTFPNTE
jgi:hypothetical protein